MSMNGISCMTLYRCSERWEYEWNVMECVWLCSVLFEAVRQERPYHSDSTASRLLSEVKHCRARLVLRWGTTLESLVLFFCSFLLAWYDTYDFLTFHFFFVFFMMNECCILHHLAMYLCFFHSWDLSWATQVYISLMMDGLKESIVSSSISSIK